MFLVTHKIISGPCLGFNMHPKWLEYYRAEDFFSLLRESGVNSLEFKLDIFAPDWPEISALIEKCRHLGFRLTFHAPHKGPYNPAGFSGAKRDELERLYRPAIEYAARFAESHKPNILVLHGAKGAKPRKELFNDTNDFLAWILDDFSVIQPAIELLVKDKNINKIGDNKSELVEITSGLGSPNIGICWDLGHDALNGSKESLPNFVNQVKHVHVHDISTTAKDHSPLIFGNVPYAKHLRRLLQMGYKGAVILEVNGYLIAQLAATRKMQPGQLLRVSFEKINNLLCGFQ